MTSACRLLAVPIALVAITADAVAGEIADGSHEHAASEGPGFGCGLVLDLGAADAEVVAASPAGRDRLADRNPALAAMPDNRWLHLRPKGMAHARMYSGCCAGGGLLWYF